MQQRQLRLGDILDDYCPRERRLTNHAVVAMVDEDVKRTRCTTCDAEHEYKHARVPHQRRKAETPAALYSQVVADAPKKISHEPEPAAAPDEDPPAIAATPNEVGPPAAEGQDPDREHSERGGAEELDGASETPGAAEDQPEGPVHRRLIRATLPRVDGAPPQRPIPEFTIRQPGGRQNRFRGRHNRGGGGQTFHGGGRPNSGRPGSGRSRQGGHGRKRSK